MTSSVPTPRSVVSVVDYQEMKHSRLEFLDQHLDVLALPMDRLEVTVRTVHHIQLKPDTTPVSISAYRLPHSQRKAVDEMVKNMLDQGEIQELFSPGNSLLFLVPKKDGSLRQVIDFRRVSDVTVDDHYLLPVLRDIRTRK